MSTDSELRPAELAVPTELDGGRGTHIGLSPADIAPVLRSGRQVTIPIGAGDLDDGGTQLTRPNRIASADPPGPTDDAAGSDSTGGETAREPTVPMSPSGEPSEPS